jgi:hypothetical protein
MTQQFSNRNSIGNSIGNGNGKRATERGVRHGGMDPSVYGKTEFSDHGLTLVAADADTMATQKTIESTAQQSTKEGMVWHGTAMVNSNNIRQRHGTMVNSDSTRTNGMTTNGMATIKGSVGNGIESAGTLNN